MRVCGKCKINKLENEDNFRLRKYKNGKTFFHSICKECSRIDAIIYANQHKDIRNKRAKLFYINNPEYKKNWRKQNKSKINKQERARCKNDIVFKLRKNFSGVIRRALKKLHSKKVGSIINHINYTILELKIHFENQFDDKMNWDNHGIYWHIDHIIPQSDLPYISMEDDNFKICWALSNLRPLEAKQNMRDGATRVRHKKKI